ncbi:hypothetical protein [Natronolimnobius baerhuensis]|nr:hypothetical protein [Natronolimnobius baerhuensis]
MPDQELLLSLLQFVGLVAPAIAILMQALMSFHDSMDINRSGFPLELELLTVSLLMIVSGGIVIGVSLLSQLDNPLVILGTGLTFLSLLFVIGAIITTIIRSAWLRSSADDFKTHLLNLTSILYYIFVASSVNIFFFGLALWAFWTYLDPHLQYGIFAQYGPITPTMVVGIILLVLFMRSIMVKWEEGILFRTDNQMVIKYSFVASLSLIVFAVVFIFPSILIIAIFELIPDHIISLDESHKVYNIPVVWSIFILILIYAIPLNLLDEEEIEEYDLHKDN